MPHTRPAAPAFRADAHASLPAIARSAYDRHDRRLIARITVRPCSRGRAMLSSRLDGDLRARDRAVSPCVTRA
ncbi:hypothetical protein EGY20_16540 [Burkholderia multivorans]|nr:hypothetical protein EGY20_16540 [Burkholderia multivorans]